MTTIIKVLLIIILIPPALVIVFAVGMTVYEFML